MTVFDRKLALLLISNALASVGVGVAMIAIPWLLVTRTDGGALFGILITTANIALATLVPVIGIWIDCLSRKRFMIALRIGFAAGLVVVLSLATLHAPMAKVGSLVLYYLLGATFYAINIPLRTAFVQELYFGEDYSRVNSVLEVENQIAAVATGALAVLMVERVGLGPIVGINLICLAVATLCILAIPYKRATHPIERCGLLVDIRAGFNILTRRPALCIILLVATLPYVTVILYTYLHPVALAQLVGAAGTDYAIVEMLFAIGAVIGGWALIARPVSSSRTTPWITRLIWAFTIVAAIQAFAPTKLVFFIIAVLFGLINALVRILRQTLLMAEASPSEIGRIGAFIQSWIMGLRALSFGIATLLVARVGIAEALWFAATLTLLGALALLILGAARRRIPPNLKEAIQ